MNTRLKLKQWAAAELNREDDRVRPWEMAIWVALWVGIWALILYNIR